MTYTDKLTEATRESWLLALTAALRPDFEALGKPLPERIQVSVGWPSIRALSRKNKRVGEAWDRPERQPEQDPESGIWNVFISPVLSQSDADHVLVHELCHLAAGVKHGHKAPFKHVARGMGLEGKLTATSSGADLRARLDALCEPLGAYPHEVITPVPTPFRGSRLLKATCGCGKIIRLSRRVMDLAGIQCTDCGMDFQSTCSDRSEGY